MQLEEIANLLHNATITNKPCQPIRSFLAEKDLTAAYKIQTINIEKAKAEEKKEIGKKIGLTNKKVQEQLGVDQPDFGILLDSMQIEPDGVIMHSKFLQPKVEAEIAFVLKEDITTPPTIESLKQAIDYALIAIEIVGSRIKDWDIKITDTIADNASSSHFVVGKKPIELDKVDLENCKMQLYINDQLVSDGSGASCLGNPLNAVQWLATKMIEIGNPLKKGEIILSGALGPMVVLQKGDVVKAHIEGLGELAFRTI
ncbi:2-keto-4-pentenoate hydratase [Haloflavibacter putidus]|uniref:2-keto-4-pentenoate hydratase n=1 Tax=Haloflavibacter putidus TaxID=2576776 RepID=A0A507ZIN5_9FLAO|nr:fumarylacetoacetate hydrolase family protein [Haloflavibacter putidus]TQD34795.1 2-keto-4-pentenoate hydratase [Haloflavibacter putidus]